MNDVSLFMKILKALGYLFSYFLCHHFSQPKVTINILRKFSYKTPEVTPVAVLYHYMIIFLRSVLPKQFHDSRVFSFRKHENLI